MSAHQHPLLSIDEDFDLRRLAPLSKRLRWRRPITSLAIGSSLTGVHGGCTEPAPVLLSDDGSSTCKCPLCCGSRCGSWGMTGWARSVHEHLRKKYPHPNSKCINLGEPGGTLIPAIVACPLTYLNMDGPHLVLVDALTSKLEDIERLLRHLLRRRALPVLVQFFRFFAQGGGCQTSPSGSARRIEVTNGTVTSLSWLRRELARNLGSHHTLPSLLREFFSDGFNDTMWRLEAAVGPDTRVRSGFGKSPRIVRILREDREQMIARRTLWRHYQLPVANLFAAYALAAERGDFDVCDATIGDGFHPKSTRGGWVAAAVLAPLERALARMNASFERAHARAPGQPPLPTPLHLNVRSASSAFEERRRSPSQQGSASVATSASAAVTAAAASASAVSPKVGMEWSGLMCFSFDQAGYALATASRLTRTQRLWTIARGGRVELRSIARFGVLPRLVRKDGWAFVAREMLSRTKDKPGIAAEEPGATLEIELSLPSSPAGDGSIRSIRSSSSPSSSFSSSASPSSSPPSSSSSVFPSFSPSPSSSPSSSSSSSSSAALRSTGPPPPGQCSLVLEHLNARTGFGRVALRCSEGCDCERRVIDAAKGSLPVGTILRATRVPLRWDRPLPCRVELLVLNRTSSFAPGEGGEGDGAGGGGHRFKLARLLVEQRVPRGS